MKEATGFLGRLNVKCGHITCTMPNSKSKYNDYRYPSSELKFTLPMLSVLCESLTVFDKCKGRL